MTQHIETLAEVPLTSNGVPIRNIWHMLLYAWRQLPLMKEWRSDVESAPTLDALFAKILCSLVKQRIRIGLGRNYRNQAEQLRGVRGRIDFTASLKRLAFPNGRAFCHFQTFDEDVPKNQIVRSSLHRLAQRGDFGKKIEAVPALRHELRQLVRDLDHVRLIELKPDVVRRHELERDDRDYRLMLAICYLVLQREMPTETKGARSLYGLERDWEFLWKVFEEFVARFFQHYLQDWKVRAQKNIYWESDGDSAYLPSMRPDLVMEHLPTGQIVVLDTKFTGKSLIEGQHKTLTFDQGHIFQLYAYLRSQEERSATYRVATGVLLYPSVRHHLAERTLIQGHTFRWETVDLRKPWQEIEASLLNLAASLTA